MRDATTWPYTAVFEYDDALGMWSAELMEARSVHGFGRTIPEARDGLRESLAVWLNDRSAGAAAQITEIFPQKDSKK